MIEVITDAKGRKIAYKELDPSDMLDLLEAAGAQSTNQGWMRMAMVVASVTAIGDVPVPPARVKEQIRTIARQLGNVGLIALNDAIFGPAIVSGDSAPVATVVSDAAEAAKN